ncbi:MAG TPA: hypothetical protein VI702_06195 [Nitrospiria bacterium]
MEDKNGKTARPMRQVFTITERNGKSYWVRIGASFRNQDGSDTVLLDALPISGRMQIRLAAAKEAVPSRPTASAVSDDDGD